MNSSGIWNKVYIGFTLTLTGFVVNQKRFLISQSRFRLHILADFGNVSAAILEGLQAYIEGSQPSQ